MPDDPSLVTLAVLSVIGGLAAFAVLLLAGVRLVRWLALPQDLPDLLRFEPPPPPLRATGDAAAARVAAERQGRLRAAFARGLEAQRCALRCHELQVALDQAAASGTGPDGEALRAAAATGARAAATARAAAGAADQLAGDAGRRHRAVAEGLDDAAILALDQALAAQAVTATGALAEAEAAAARLSDADGRRRIWVMLMVLGALLAWVVAMQVLLRH
jgi:hypothetical protein